MDYQKILRNITIGFVGLLVVLTFFSQTLMDMHSPRVSVGFIEAGATTPEVMATGLVVPAQSVVITSPVTGTVITMAEPGAVLNIIGASLFTMVADTQNLYARLVAVQDGLKAITIQHEYARELWNAAVASEDVHEIMKREFRFRALGFERANLADELHYLMKIINENGLFNVRPEFTQRVERLHVESGARVVAGDPVITSAVLDGQFMIYTYFSQSVDFLRLMDTVAIQVGGYFTLGNIRSISPQGNRIRVSVSVNSTNLQGGEMALVTATGMTQRDAHVISTVALRQDVAGYYILYVETEPRRIGRAYILRNFRVEVRRRDNWNVSIAPAFGQEDMPEGPIVVNSDRPVVVGSRVRLAQ